MANTLHESVRAWARGILPTEAGAELLIRQGRVYDGAPWIENYGDVAAIDTDKLLYESGAWSGGEQRIVRLAASLLGGPAVDLSDNIPGLDRRNLALVLAALAHAGGSHQDSGVRYDADGEPIGFEPLTTLYPWPAEK